MARVYLETSFFSACASTRTDVASMFWKRESLAWLKSQAPHHDLFTSTETLAELSRPSYPQRREALWFTIGIEILDVTPEVIGLARVMINSKVMPGPLEGDAVHVAAATWHRMDYVLSWNVKHLANPNKRTHLYAVCMRFGLVPPIIVTPSNLWEPDDDAR